MEQLKGIHSFLEEGDKCTCPILIGKIQGRAGKRSNNFAEFMALKLALLLAAEKGAVRIKMFGDSQVVIKWMEGVLLHVKTSSFVPYLMTPCP